MCTIREVSMCFNAYVDTDMNSAVYNCMHLWCLQHVYIAIKDVKCWQCTCPPCSACPLTWLAWCSTLFIHCVVCMTLPGPWHGLDACHLHWEHNSQLSSTDNRTPYKCMRTSVALYLRIGPIVIAEILDSSEEGEGSFPPAHQRERGECGSLK